MPNTQPAESFETPAEPEIKQETAADPASANEEASHAYGAFKCYFHTPKRGDIRGAFCLLFDGLKGELLENVFWVTRAYSDKPLDVNIGWRELTKVIPEIGPYEKSLGEKLSNSLLGVFTSARRMEILQHSSHSEILKDVCEDIQKDFERITHYFLELEAALETLSVDEMIEAGVLSEEKEQEERRSAENTDEKKSFADTIIHCLPVIDPIHGKPVSELQPGDMIEVKIQGGVGATGLVQQYLISTNQDAIFPVESIERKTDEKTYILLGINEEIKGLITVTKDLRLRVLEKKKRTKSISFSINIDNLIFFGTLAVAAVVILWLVKYLFF